MFSRGVWLRIWIVLTVVWTIIVATWGWINLPKAQHLPHNPEFLSRLSNEAASILIGSESKAKPSGWGEPIWLDAPISVPMPNRARLTFPSTTNTEGIALVRNEYYTMLEAEADAQTGPYVLRMIFAWLMAHPILLVLDLAADLIRRTYRPAAQQSTPASAAAGWIKPREVAPPLSTDNPPAYDSNWRWGVAARHAEHGFRAG